MRKTTYNPKTLFSRVKNLGEGSHNNCDIGHANDSKEHQTFVVYIDNKYYIEVNCIIHSTGEPTGLECTEYTFTDLSESHDGYDPIKLEHVPELY